MNKPAIYTLGQLKASGYQSRSVKEEIRQNLIEKLQSRTPAFPGILGYENTVIPELETAVLSRHNILLLGLRGQAKTRIARQMVSLLDEWIPVVSGSEINDDPLIPISRYARELVAEKGDETPVDWLHRSERYSEKLATPDVSVADLIGDIDPIKAANLKLHFGDERVMHYGIIPRSHRGLFVINELPDLQARIQVALFNILQEGDVQIRGFKLRMPLDIMFVFTANPEDYTNRGSIVTPLKDRIESQIMTHYPGSVDVSERITQQEAHLHPDQEGIAVPRLCKMLVEQIAMEARHSEFVDQKSGVSARLTISAYENMVSYAERRSIINGDAHTQVRIADLNGVVAAITGKIELVYEGEQEGALPVAQKLISQAIKSLFLEHFPDPENYKRKRKDVEGLLNVYQPVIDWFSKGNVLELLWDTNDREYTHALGKVDGLVDLVRAYVPDAEVAEMSIWMEFVLHGMAACSLISKQSFGGANDRFADILGSMLNMDMGSFEDWDDEEL